MATRRWVAVVALAALAWACGGGPSLTTVEPVDAPAVPAPLRFRGPTVSDGDLDLTRLVGRPVAFWFWSPSCSDCSAAALTAETAHRMVRDRVTVVGVSCGSPEPLRAFERRYGLTFPTLVDTDGLLASRLEIVCATAWVFVDPAGGVRWERRTLDLDELTDRLWALTETSAP